MDNLKRNIIGLIILLVFLVIFLVMCIFSNALLYSPKAFADKSVSDQLEKLDKSISKIRKKSEDSLDFMYLKPNSIYTADLTIDKRFAFENNLPYFDDLSAFLTTFSNDTEAYSTIGISSGEDTIVELDMVVTNDTSIIAVPALIDGYYTPDNPNIEYLEDDEYASSSTANLSLVNYLISYSSLEPDKFTELTIQLITDALKQCPEDCYLVSCGAFGKSEVIISVTEPELAAALCGTIEKNADNPLFREMIESSFSEVNYEDFITSFTAGLKEIKCSDQNVYTIYYTTGITGSIKTIGVSYIIDGSFKSYEASFKKSRIELKTADNSKFENEEKVYTEKTLDLVYGFGTDGSIDGYVQYTEDEGNALVYFDDLKLDNDFINGSIKLMMASDKFVGIVMDSENKDITISYNREGESLVSIHGYRTDCTEAPLAISDIKTGQAYYDADEYVIDAISSDRFTEVYEELQIDLIFSFIETLYDMYTETE